MNRRSNKHVNGWFRLTVASSVVFIGTIFVMVAAAFSGRNLGLTRFLNDRGGMLLAIEVGVTLLLGLIAMSVDRRETLRQARRQAADNANASSADAAPRT